MVDLKALYKAEKAFRDYVDKYARSQRITIDVALTHKLVGEYASWLIGVKNGK